MSMFSMVVALGQTIAGRVPGVNTFVAGRIAACLSASFERRGEKTHPLGGVQESVGEVRAYYPVPHPTGGNLHGNSKLVNLKHHDHGSRACLVTFCTNHKYRGLLRPGFEHGKKKTHPLGGVRSRVTIAILAGMKYRWRRMRSTVTDRFAKVVSHTRAAGKLLSLYGCSEKEPS